MGEPVRTLQPRPPRPLTEDELEALTDDELDAAIDPYKCPDCLTSRDCCLFHHGAAAGWDACVRHMISVQDRKAHDPVRLFTGPVFDELRAAHEGGG